MADLYGIDAMNSAWDGLRNDRDITELPHYAINHNSPEDTFFTDREVAEHCFNAFMCVAEKNGINVEEYHFIEPSAGEGCFYDLLPPGRRTGMDIAPRNKNIKKADFLSWYPSQHEKYIAIGNPPFGHRGAYALAFVNRAFLFADIVAFILPMSFYSNGKGTNMERVKNARLIHSEPLKGDSFYMPDTKTPMSVKTVFQVWEKGERTRVFNDYDVSDYAEIYTCCSSPSRYCGLGRGRKYDCFIASTFYRNKNIGIVSRFEDVQYGSGYGIIIKQKKREIKRILRETNWRKYASDSTNHCMHLRMNSIRRRLGDAGFGVRL